MKDRKLNKLRYSLTTEFPQAMVEERDDTLRCRSVGKVRRMK